MTHLIMPRRKCDEGFTLLEVMISLAVLAVGILGVVGMFSTSIGGNTQGKRMTEATNYAQSKLDYLVNAEVYENLTSGTETVGMYTLTWRKTEPVADLGNTLKRIDMTATWVSKDRTHTVELSTLRAKN